MSGIYIPGMEMPTDSHPTWIVLHSDGTVEYNEVSQSNPVGWNTLIQAAIPVPDHGRLIDADKLGTPAKIEEDTLWRGRIETEVYLASTIYNAPTIIPADKEAGEC